MDLCALLKNSLPALSLQPDFSFARHTTFGIGGTAAVAASPGSEEELAALLHGLHLAEIPYCYLGAGANVLAADGRFEGVVIRFDRMRKLSCDLDRAIVTAGAGVTGGALLRFARERGIGGLEFLAGIPMTVGGAVVMNAGTAEGYIGDCVRSVTAVTERGEAEFSHADCGFSQKYSVFQEKIAIGRVALQGERCAPETIRAREQGALQRRSRLPRGRSAGCIFVNPAGNSAGRLIDGCGLKGLRVGGAFVSPEHANFILSENATEKEVDALIRQVQRTVFERTGIFLREEVKRLP